MNDRWICYTNLNFATQKTKKKDQKKNPLTEFRGFNPVPLFREYVLNSNFVVHECTLKHTRINTNKMIYAKRWWVILSEWGQFVLHRVAPSQIHRQDSFYTCKQGWDVQVLLILLPVFTFLSAQLFVIPNIL